MRATFPVLGSIEGGFADMEVVALGPEHALATGTFREAITDNSGVGMRQHGAVTWLWRRIDGEWRIVYGQVDHRLDESRK